jgi:cytochrome c553
MGGMAAMLSEEDMKSLSVYFSQQKLKPSAAKDPVLVAEGQKIWRMGDFNKGVPACAGCHGAAGAGLPAQYPALSGQYAEYTEDQLKKFRLDERANDQEKVMRTIAAKLSDRQIKAVAEYAAGLRP